MLKLKEKLYNLVLCDLKYLSYVSISYLLNFLKLTTISSKQETEQELDVLSNMSVRCVCWTAAAGDKIFTKTKHRQ